MKLLQDLLREFARDGDGGGDGKPEGPRNIQELIDDLCERDEFEDIEYISTEEKNNGDVVIELDGWWYERHSYEFHKFVEELEKSPLVSSVEQRPNDCWRVVKAKVSKKK